MEKRVLIHTELIRLDQLLKLAGAVGTGGEAKEVIRAGRVSVNGVICTERGRKLYAGDRVAFAGNEYLCTAE